MCGEGLTEDIHSYYLRYEAPSQVFFEKLRIRSAAILRNIPSKNPKGVD